MLSFPGIGYTGLANANLEYEVVMILAHRDTVYRKKSVRQYFVQWVGYGSEHNTWEPESELLRKCSTLITAYWAIVKGQPQHGISCLIPCL